ncbi:CPBP family intramembrane glutamic endopeptidase [Simiduia agarivorans]|uniref:Abortive infection protein n=1 Tax=Simiduia agarivorans (strain DSM 21679 / JCM 13881 / BCRC 17597 / SA1) TaxID=1117647 RepID=K4KLW9_SIMAS|nr:CPBP family intramembrane glutamic endopeptidase [Simiduia agarivorans]AFU99078.1 Abortive infection protein [Simiduia agarivorans SA1 = DSM 21679]
MHASRARWLELIILFGLCPLVGFVGRHWLGSWMLPVLIGLAFACTWLILRDPGFKRFRLVNAGNLWPALKRRRAVFATGLAASALLFVSGAEAEWFRLPTQDTGSWLILLVAYPLLSVLPQELIFRTFFFHRYKKIIPSKKQRAWLSASVFAWAHIVYGNWVAVLLAFAGGVLFAFTYAKKRSTLACVVEHSLWGLWLFSFGLGEYLDANAL